MNRKYIEYKLMEIGFSPAYKGFSYIVDAILILGDPEWKCSKITQAYEKISKIHKSTYARVEKDIRYALKAARNTKNPNVNQYLGTDYPQTKNTLYRILYSLSMDSEIVA
mgnify:CR=1 FL=1